MPDQLVKLTEAAELVQVPYSTVKHWRDERRFEAKEKVTSQTQGSYHLYSLEEIRAYAEKVASERRDRLPEGYLYLHDAAKLLGVQHATMYARAAERGCYGAMQVDFCSLKRWVVLKWMIEEELGTKTTALAPDRLADHERPLIAGSDTLCIAARREKLRRDGIRVNVAKLLEEWKRVG